jgi:hypothetical protein
MKWDGPTFRDYVGELAGKTIADVTQSDPDEDDSYVGFIFTDGDILRMYCDEEGMIFVLVPVDLDTDDVATDLD